MQNTDDLANQLKAELLAETIRSRGAAMVRVTGASMLPAIWPGDVLKVRKQDANRIIPGEVVLCRRDGGVQAHRVARHCGDHLITRGDTLTVDDPPLPIADMLGQVTSIVRGGTEIPLVPRSWSRIVSSVLRRSDWAITLLLSFVSKRFSTVKKECAWPS